MSSWRCLRISRSKFVLVSLCFLFLVLLFHLYNENTNLKARLKSLEASNLDCKVLASLLKQGKCIGLLTTSKGDEQSNAQEETTVPVFQANKVKEARGDHQSRTMPNPKPLVRSPRKFSPQDLSIILYEKSGIIVQDSRLDQLRRMFPKSNFFWKDNDDGNIATTLNKIVPKIKTEYLLFLEPNVIPSERPQEDVTLLWNALEKYPELDLVGGSYLSKNKLYVQCNRYRLCRWTFSESYEYVRFLDNVMICDGISSSFMARTRSIQNIPGGLDPKMPDVVVLKDFFFRAKSYNFTAGTRPSMMFLIGQLKNLYELWMSREITKELIPFAVKHKIFIFKDFEGNLIEFCSPTSPLSGKDLCIERNSHNLMLDGGHWAFKGLYAYPYLYKYLVKTLLVVTNHFEKHNVSYRIKGGISLGSVKMHSVLPWDSGDVDVHVFGLNLKQIYDLFEPLAKKEGYFLRLWSDQVHIFCTPREVGDLSGGIATIFAIDGPSPELMKIKTNGKWITYDRTLFAYLIKKYGEDKYLGHSMHGGRETMECKIKGHNACLPNFKSFLDGRGGTAREYFCEI